MTRKADHAYAKWAHLTSPRGEGLQGFWVFIGDESEPLNSKPLATYKEACAVAKLENAAEYLLQNHAGSDMDSLEQAFNIIDGAYRVIIGWKEPQRGA